MLITTNKHMQHFPRFELIAYDFATTFNLHYRPLAIKQLHSKRIKWLNANGPDNWSEANKRIVKEFITSQENLDLVYNSRLYALKKVNCEFDAFAEFLIEEYDPLFRFELHPKSYELIEAYMNKE